MNSQVKFIFMLINIQLKLNLAEVELIYLATADEHCMYTTGSLQTRNGAKSGVICHFI